MAIRLVYLAPALLAINLLGLLLASGLLLWPGAGPTAYTVAAIGICLVAATTMATATIWRQVIRGLAQASAALATLGATEHATAPPRSRLRELDALVAGHNSMAQRLRSSRQLLLRQAFIDPLTGLANRASFMSRLANAVNADNGRHVTVVYLDLDNFKNINDTLGHAVGDALLALVGGRLQAAAGPKIFVARLGGDEFTLLAEGADAEARAVAVTDQFLRRMQRPIAVSGHELFVSASAGITVSERPSTSTELLRRADIALYRAKAGGRGKVVLFRLAEHDIQPGQLQLAAEIRRAIERNQLRLVYQPEVHMATGRVGGMEALVRWEHPELGLLPPSRFLDIAESAGETAAIGRWVLFEACRQAMAFARATPMARGLVLSINLTAPDFRDPGLASRVAAVLRETGLKPSCLRIELTESLLVEDVHATIGVFQQLHDLGVRIAIDDFGTGYSSLSYIQDFAVNTLKVDQSFVRRIGEDTRSDAILATIAELARALSMELTAEGVETAAQLEFLRGCGYQNVQGHLFSAPLAPEAFVAFLRASVRQEAAASA